MSKVEDIKWSRQSYSLKDVLRKYTFPQILKVTAGTYSPEENECFSTGQVMRVHQLCRQTRVLASDRKGNHISIPIRYGNARFEIITKGKKSKPMYLREIIDKSLLPREVRFAVDDDPRFRLQFANTITVEEKFNSLLLKTMYEESFIQGNAINQNLLDTMVINLPVHAKLEVAVAESFRDAPIANWDKYTNLLERLVSKHVTFRLNAGNNQMTFFSDKRLEKNTTQKDIEHATPAAILYVETNLKRRPSSAGSPSSKTVGPVRTRSRSVDQLADKPRSLGARGSKTYVNAMQREERLKKAVSTGDILKDTDKNKKNKKGSGSEKGSFSGWLLGTLTGRRKKKRPTVIENTPEGDHDQTPNNDVTETKQSQEATPVVQNGRGRKATKSAEKSTEKRSKSQPARQKLKVPKKENSKPESKTNEQTKTLNKKAGTSTSTSEVKTKKPKEVAKAKEVTNAQAKKTPVKALAPSVPKAQTPTTPKAQAQPTTKTQSPKAQAPSTPKAQAPSTPTAQALPTPKAQAPSTPVQEPSSKSQGTLKSGKSTPTLTKKMTNQTNAKSKQTKQVKDANQQTETQKTPREKRDSGTSTTPRSILKKGKTPSISSYSSNSSADRMEVRNETRPETFNGIHKYPTNDRPVEGTEFYATLRQNMPVDIPVPDYKKQEMEQQRALSAYATIPRSPRSKINQPINNNWKQQSDITNISPNQHLVGAIIHQYPEDETDYMNADVEMYPHHIYSNAAGVGPPSPPPPPAFRDFNSQPPMAQPPPPPPPPIFNSQRADFVRSESEPLPQNQFSNQLARLKPVQISPKPKPQNQTGDLMSELKMATERRKSQSDLLDINGLNTPTFNNGYAPRRESDAFPFNRQKMVNGGTLPETKRQFSSPAIHYSPRTGPQTQPKPKFRHLNSSSDIRNMSDVPRNLKGVNVAQISDCMRLLNLEKYIETFKTHKIDGEMLVDLNKEMLKSDLGMSEIDAAKVMKFATGWRPQ